MEQREEQVEEEHDMNVVHEAIAKIKEMSDRRVKIMAQVHQEIVRLENTVAEKQEEIARLKAEKAEAQERLRDSNS